MYTVGLPRETRAERRDEIASDVYEHCATDGHGPAARSVRAAIIGRTLRGVPGDVLWRIEEGHAMKRQQRAAVGRPGGFQAAWATVTQAWFTPIAVLLGIFNLGAAVAVALDPGSKMPGQVVGPIFLVGFAVSMFTGLWLRWRTQFDGDRARVTARVRRPLPPSATSLLIGLAFLGVAFIILGAMTTPLATVVGASFLIVAVGVAAAGLRRRGVTADDRLDRGVDGRGRPAWVADALIVAGTLPAIGLFWMVVPGILALIVIGGVIGTQPGARARIPA